jgi:hypothetical protein
VSKTKLAITPSVRSAKKAKKAGQGRFDVDGILTEIDKVPTPTDKKAATNPTAATPAATTKTSDSTPGRGKDVACTLFDTPTNAAAPPCSKRKSRKKKDADEATSEVAEVEEEPDTKAAHTDATEPPAVINISSDGNADESGVVEAEKTEQETKAPVKKSAAKKRKSAEAKEPARASSKKQKKDAATSKKARAASSPKLERVFLLTGDREQATLHTSIISALGGSVSDFGRVFDGNCTHIICSELKRTEKFIAGCAAGKVRVDIPCWIACCS